MLTYYFIFDENRLNNSSNSRSGLTVGCIWTRQEKWYSTGPCWINRPETVWRWIVVYSRERSCAQYIFWTIFSLLNTDLRKIIVEKVYIDSDWQCANQVGLKLPARSSPTAPSAWYCRTCSVSSLTNLAARKVQVSSIYVYLKMYQSLDAHVLTFFGCVFNIYSILQMYHKLICLQPGSNESSTLSPCTLAVDICKWWQLISIQRVLT